MPSGALTQGAEKYRITTVAAGQNGVTACGDVGFGTNTASTLAGVASMTLRPFFGVRRTTVLTPPDLGGAFVPTNAGRLTIGSGGGAIDVCLSATDCMGGAADAGVMTLNTADPGVPADGAVPAACIAANTAALCTGSVLDTFAFGLPADAGNNCLNLVTTNTPLCNSPPFDGFTLQVGQVIVFIYQDLFMVPLAVGSAGFSIDTDGMNVPACPANSVVAVRFFGSGIM